MNEKWDTEMEMSQHPGSVRDPTFEITIRITNLTVELDHTWDQLEYVYDQISIAEEQRANKYMFYEGLEMVIRELLDPRKLGTDETQQIESLANVSKLFEIRRNIVDQYGSQNWALLELLHQYQSIMFGVRDREGLDPTFDATPLFSVFAPTKNQSLLFGRIGKDAISLLSRIDSIFVRLDACNMEMTNIARKAMSEPVWKQTRAATQQVTAESKLKISSLHNRKAELIKEQAELRHQLESMMNKICEVCEHAWQNDKDTAEFSGDREQAVSNLSSKVENLLLLVVSYYNKLEWNIEIFDAGVENVLNIHKVYFYDSLLNQIATQLTNNKQVPTQLAEKIRIVNILKNLKKSWDKNIQGLKAILVRIVIKLVEFDKLAYG